MTAMRKRWRGARGQTTTEYLMISGLITVIAIILLNIMQPHFRQTLQNMTECMINRDCTALTGS